MLLSLSLEREERMRSAETALCVVWAFCLQETKSETAELIKSYIKDGKIVPVAITVGLLKKAILEHHARGRSYFLVDGFPRNKDNLDGWNAVMTGVANVRFCIMFGTVHYHQNQIAACVVVAAFAFAFFYSHPLHAV